MDDTEEYFPRGGKKPTLTHFKQSANFLGAPEKTEKKKKKPKKKSEGDDGYLSDEATKEVDQSYKNCAYGLSYKTIKDGLLVLGRVKSIMETKVLVSLPCRIIGAVMACHISETYNKLLEAYVNDQTDKVVELNKMFRVGQYIACKVLEVKEMSIMLSVMPQHVNNGKTLADLHKGILIQAAVSSVEDHGYVMDIGIPDTRAFLPKDKCNPDVDLEAGMVTWCAIKSCTDNVVKLRNELTALQNSWVKRKPQSPLLPGSALEFLVETPLDNGIEGHVFKDMASYIQRQHADSVKGKKPSLGQKIRARLLYVMPTRNTPFLTMKNIFEASYPDLEQEQVLKDGDIVDEAQVLKITGRAIHFRLGNGCYGTMSLKRIQVDEDLTDEEVIAKSYPIGSTHKVRVICYNLSDYAYSVSDQPELISVRYFNLEQLVAGDLVDATVNTVTDNHVLLNVGRVTGFVPQMHMFESGIFVHPKKTSTSKFPKKKFKVGQQTKARVLAVDLVKQTLFLTLKPSLLAEDLEVLSSYEQAEIGKAYTGVIRTIRDFVLVSFFNNVTAYVPKHYVTKEPLDNISDAFHIGQIVNCTILRVDPEAKKMSGSLVTVPFWPAKKLEPKQKRKLKGDNTDDVPNKKLKNNDQTELISNKQKKAKKNETTDESDIETEIDRNLSKKDKKKKVPTEEQIDKNNKKKKNKVKPESTEPGETELHKKNKKSHKTTDGSDVETEVKILTKKDKKKNKLDEHITTEEIDKTKKKKIKLDIAEESTDSDYPEDKVNINKKKDKTIKEISEESDAIDTDIYEDTDEVLNPQELGLVDLSDCTTNKQFKKRVVSLLKAVNNRSRRLDKIDAKITKIENQGLDSENKKFHTAMHAEKITVKQRIEKLLEALHIAQERLKEVGVDVDNSDKKEKKTKEVKKEKIKNRKELIKDEDVQTKEKEKVEVKKKTKKREIKVVGKLEPALDAPSVKEFWSADADTLSKTVQEEDSSSSEDEEKDQPKKKRKKLTVAEKLAKAREEEERVRDMEKRAIESESQPRSSEQFERALLANPNCSQLWIAYMAFYLQSTEIDKARAVGRKALSTISFREELEKLNVWLAMINFENRFGTKESQQKTLEEALQSNDPYKIHSKLLDIYVETSKQQDLTALVDLMMRKYKRDPQCYIQCGSACFKLGLVDKARQVMQKAISVLEKKDHVTVLVKFALLERSHGAGERAEALFEQVLAVYPQRVDVCSTYIDMLLKSSDIQHIRQVMERMTSHKLPARKMKILYKKWIEVEEKIGDQEQVDKIRQRAMEYIEKAKF